MTKIQKNGKNAAKMQLFFLFAARNICRRLRLLPVVCEKFHQNGVLAHLHNLADGNEKFGCIFEKIPRSFFTRHNKPLQKAAFQAEYDVHDMPQPAAVNHIDDLFASKFKK